MSVFDTTPCNACAPSPLAHDPTVFLSPQSESLISPEFEIISGCAIVRAFDLTHGAVRIEMVHGYAESLRTALAMREGTAWALTAVNTLFVIDVPGRYRLVGSGLTLGPLMPTLVVTRVMPGWP